VPMVTKRSPPQTGHARRVAVRGVPTPCSEDFGSGVRLGHGATSQNRIATDQQRATRHGWPTARFAAMSLTRMRTRPSHEQRGSTTRSACGGCLFVARIMSSTPWSRPGRSEGRGPRRHMKSYDATLSTSTVGQGLPAGRSAAATSMTRARWSEVAAVSVRPIAPVTSVSAPKPSAAAAL